MSLRFDDEGIEFYRSMSQRIRVMSERWVQAHQFCPACGFHSLKQFASNRPVADFFCENCQEQFELKSKRGHFGRKIADGAYRTMIQRITSDTNPNFLLLSYSNSPGMVADLELVPKHFFTPQMIEKRTPLSAGAQRAGWEGCNILIESLPTFGRIALIRDGEKRPTAEILKDWQTTTFLRDQPNSRAKTWLLTVMHCVEQIGRLDFTLGDVYAAEDFLTARFPHNKHIRLRIRQQLQVLRDNNYLIFTGRGRYRLSRQWHVS